MLKVKYNKAKSYYHYRSLYTVSDIKPPQLIAIPKESSTEEPHKVNKVVVCLEDMFDECMKVHKAVGYQGRSTMEPEAAKFYANSRMQIDLVDFQSLPDGEYKWILNAQDHLTKFSICDH